MKYDTFAALKAAYDSSELSREHVLVLDNDACFVYTDEECVYQGHPETVLEDVLNLLNIPWEPA